MICGYDAQLPYISGIAFVYLLICFKSLSDNYVSQTFHHCDKYLREVV
jgi:hypothetical protein